MVRPIVQHHPIMTMMSKDSIIGAIHAFTHGMILSITMLVIECLWLIALFYTSNMYSTLSAIESSKIILAAITGRLLFDYMIVWWFMKWHDYKQFNIILIMVVGYLFGCLLWFILDAYTLNPVLHLFGLQFKSSELEYWNTLWSVIYMVIIIYAIVDNVQENDIDQDNFAYTLMMV
jgi:hypothetical protein